MTVARVPEPRHGRLWIWAQAVALLATVALLVGFVLRPEPSLDILWNLLIPLVPASLLISPMIWRNVCPLATLNLLGNRRAGTLELTGRSLWIAGVVGIALLVVLVPARRFLFNTNGVALAVTVAAVALLALGLGAFFQVKAGFCNSICPVLPVERLYGQHPLLQVGNPRCQPCTMCTAKGCIDLSPVRSIPATLNHGRHWLLRPYGIFAAAFPGFVYGYYALEDGPLGSFAAVYLSVAGWSLASYLVTAALVMAFRPRVELTMVFLATAAAGLYYWYVSDAATRAFDIAGTPTLIARVATLSLVAFWAWSALRATRSHSPAAPIV